MNVSFNLAMTLYIIFYKVHWGHLSIKFQMNMIYTLGRH